MARDERLKQQIIDYLILNREAILMDNQMKFCGPCGGMKATKVFRNPDCGHIGRLLEAYLASGN